MSAFVSVPFLTSNLLGYPSSSLVSFPTTRFLNGSRPPTFPLSIPIFLSQSPTPSPSLFLIITSSFSSSSSSSSSSCLSLSSPSTPERQPHRILVFGASGRTGQRIVREALRREIPVTAAVRNPSPQLRKEILLEEEEEEEWPREDKFAMVKCDVSDEKQVMRAIQESQCDCVVSAIGAPEKEALNPTNPFRIDYLGVKTIAEQAKISPSVKHLGLISSLGTENPFGFPAALLNLFWGILIWKRKGEMAFEISGIPYTIIRPGGLERLTDDAKLTRKMIVAKRNSFSGGQVSRLQIAELMVECLCQPSLSKNKILEVITSTTVPEQPMTELLAKVKSSV